MASPNRRMLVFDNVAWAGKDKGDNSQFWKEAEIIQVYGIGGRQLADVRFVHDGRYGKAHFVDCMRPMPVEEGQ